MTMSGSSLAQQAGSRAAPLRQRLTLLRQIMMRAKRSGLLDSGSGPATSGIRMVLPYRGLTAARTGLLRIVNMRINATDSFGFWELSRFASIAL
jgi:hypothetical protein